MQSLKITFLKRKLSNFKREMKKLLQQSSNVYCSSRTENKFENFSKKLILKMNSPDFDVLMPNFHAF